jgi:hypothetical protein
MPFPVDSVYIDRAAQKLGIRLPLSYIAYMQRSNGGDVEAAEDDWQLFPIFDDSDKTRIKRTCNDIVRETNVAREWPDFPSNAVAIASNGTGDKLVFLPNESGERLAETVYSWDHETGELTAVAEEFGELTGG